MTFVVEKFKSDIRTFINVLSKTSNKLAAFGFLKRFRSIQLMNCTAEKHNRLYLLTSSFQDILHRMKCVICDNTSPFRYNKCTFLSHQTYMTTFCSCVILNELFYLQF